MPDSRCQYYERRFWDLLVSANPRFSDECCSVQDRIDYYDKTLIDGLCNSNDFQSCPFYLLNKQISQE